MPEWVEGFGHRVGKSDCLILIASQGGWIVFDDGCSTFLKAINEVGHKADYGVWTDHGLPPTLAMTIQTTIDMVSLELMMWGFCSRASSMLCRVFMMAQSFLHLEDQLDIQLIHALRNLSEELRGAMELTNDIFGLQILAATFDIFLNIVITPYFFYLDVMTISSSEYVYMMSKEGKVFWTITNTLKLVFLFLPCAATTNEAKKTSFILCSLLNEDLQPGMKKELTTFLLQLLASEKRMGFSASGMFELNVSSIISVAGAVTTYLVVLIQFQSA
ncbi:hypothetical protein LSTR_LSTR006882 [Laodelphax striatellus]|uniref:Gustatory receptor n=1 Tax=Laodelphax striatellus TaxID=195883 RepID=A0A482XF36_LAOST|nr:hypothetical protein LSTR_LSTR006882 [Laodelphax striatellus]